MSTQLAGSIGLAVVAAAYALEAFHVMPTGTGQNALTLVSMAFAFLHVPLKVTTGQPAATPSDVARTGRQANP